MESEEYGTRKLLCAAAAGDCPGAGRPSLQATTGHNKAHCISFDSTTPIIWKYLVTVTVTVVQEEASLRFTAFGSWRQPSNVESSTIQDIRNYKSSALIIFPFYY